MNDRHTDLPEEPVKPRGTAARTFWRTQH